MFGCVDRLVDHCDARLCIEREKQRSKVRTKQERVLRSTVLISFRRSASIDTIRLVLEDLEACFVAFFLPGIVSSLSKVTTGDFKQGQQIIASSLEVLSFAICKATIATTATTKEKLTREEDKSFVTDITSP